MRYIVIGRGRGEIDEGRRRAARLGIHLGIDGRNILGILLGLSNAGAKRKQVAQILIHALVDPEQIGELRHLKVRRRQIGRPAVLAVPGVRELVRYEVAAAQRSSGSVKKLSGARSSLD